MSNCSDAAALLLHPPPPRSPHSRRHSHHSHTAPPSPWVGDANTLCRCRLRPMLTPYDSSFGAEISSSHPARGSPCTLSPPRPLRVPPPELSIAFRSNWRPVSSRGTVHGSTRTAGSRQPCDSEPEKARQSQRPTLLQLPRGRHAMGALASGAPPRCSLRPSVSMAEDAQRMRSRLNTSCTLHAPTSADTPRHAPKLASRP